MSTAMEIAAHMESEAARFQRMADKRAQAIIAGYEGGAFYCDYAGAAQSCRQIAEYNRRREDSA